MPLFETPRKEGMCLRPEQLFEKAEGRGGEEAPSQALILGSSNSNTMRPDGLEPATMRPRGHLESHFCARQPEQQ